MVLPNATWTANQHRKIVIVSSRAGESGAHDDRSVKSDCGGQAAIIRRIDRGGHGLYVQNTQIS